MNKWLRWAWGAVLLLAIATRLLGLPASPLAPSEVGRALASLDAVRGRGWPGSTDTPLLLIGNALLFLVFGAGDGIARLLPALAGIGVVLLPWFWRKQIGEVGALCASALLLISPLTLFAARRVEGASLAALGAGLIVTVMVRALDVAPELRPAAGAGSGLLLSLAVGIGLVSGPAFYDLLLPGLLAWAVLRRWGPQGTFRLQETRPALIGIGIALLLTTGLGFRWSGWSGVFDTAAAWLTGWQSTRPAGMGPLALLWLYEPLLVGLILVAIVAMWFRRNVDGPGDARARYAIGLWGIVAMILVVANPGTTPASISVAILPLALLAGWAIETVSANVPRDAHRWIGLHGLVGFALWVPGLLGLAQYASGFAYKDQVSLLFVGAFILVALQGLLGFLFSLRLAPRYLWRGGGLALGGILLVLQLSFLFGLAYVRENTAAEPAIGSVTSQDLGHLDAKLHQLAVLKDARPDALKVVVVDQDAELTSLLRWNLREFSELELSAGWTATSIAAPSQGTASTTTIPLIITPEDATLAQPADAQRWRGMRFVAVTTPDGSIPRCEAPVSQLCSNAVQWYLYRKSSARPLSRSVILWQAQE